ncbi:hypothetical protein LUZ60_012407 [Juncus effusus]|nr:hypothetical protein LUZ60_012407 [Juncus effusus]
MSPLLSFLLLLLFFSTSSARSILRTLPEDTNNPSSLISNGGSVSASDDLFCDSWRLSAETNNAGKWATIPQNCVGFVGSYMTGEQYASDSHVAERESLDFAKSVEMKGGSKDCWVFDVDETLLCNAPYYADNGWGSIKFNETSFNAWVDSAKAPAIPPSLKLYEELLDLGFSIVLLTGRTEDQRNITEENLLFAGYHSWSKLILRGDSDKGTTAVAYKSKKRAELEAEGYTIHGNSGDQWSDLYGSPMAARSFKLPNPMYYIS